MRNKLWTVLVGSALAATSLPGAGTAQGVTAATASISVGAGSSMYPAFDASVSRYAVSPATDGRLEVAVDGASGVWFDGVPDADGSATFTGTTAGQEISVFVDSATGRSQFALYVLPEGFPTLAGTTSGTAAPGNIALTLDRYDGGASPKFEAIVDRQGVPLYTRSTFGEASFDLKQSPKGTITAHRHTTTSGRTGAALVELDGQFHEVARHETAGRVNTDFHDGLLMADGSVWLVGYEPNNATGKTDSIIQHVSADGEVLFDWSTAPYADETTANNPDNPDYAHINSIDVQENGDVVASFRHFSSVWRIATEDRPGYQSGDVVWRLGGLHSSFSFVDGEDGPCAQHTATVQPNGNVLMFDNGGHSLFGTRCVDQDDPTHPLTERPSTRVVEFDIDEVALTATVAKTYGAADRFSGFAGSAFKLGNGNVLISWAPERTTLANEVSAGNEPVWELVDTAPQSERYVSYRAHLVAAPDSFDPAVTLDSPADGVTVEQGSEVPVTFSCTDRGGSTLQTCDGPANQRLDTTATGLHSWTVTATDGSGRTTTRTRSYTVTEPASPPPALSSPSPSASPLATTPPLATPAPARAIPDLSLRTRRRAWVGAGVQVPASQDARIAVRPGQVVKARVRLANTGDARGRFRLRAPSSLARGSIQVTYRFRGRSRTRAVTGRGWRTPLLAPGDHLRLTVRVKVRTLAQDGYPVHIRIRAAGKDGRDRVRLVLRTR